MHVKCLTFIATMYVQYRYIVRFYFYCFIGLLWGNFDLLHKYLFIEIVFLFVETFYTKKLQINKLFLVHCYVVFVNFLLNQLKISVLDIIPYQSSYIQLFESQHFHRLFGIKILCISYLLLIFISDIIINSIIQTAQEGFISITHWSSSIFFLFFLY